VIRFLDLFPFWEYGFFLVCRFLRDGDSHFVPTPMASSITTGTTGSRSRPHARKKINDDAPYTAPPSASAGTKRQAAEKADGEPRVKRKRVEPVTAITSSNSKKDAEELQRSSMVWSSHFYVTFLTSITPGRVFQNALIGPLLLYGPIRYRS